MESAECSVGCVVAYAGYWMGLSNVAVSNVPTMGLIDIEGCWHPVAVSFLPRRVTKTQSGKKRNQAEFRFVG
jgi:hypothetical protein